MCTILINPPIAIGSGGSGLATSIIISGTVTSCSCTSVTITLKCSSGFATPLPAVPVTGGTFTATFTGIYLPSCSCLKKIDVTVQCLDGIQSFTDIPLDCHPCYDLSLTAIPSRVCVNAPFQFQLANTAASGTTPVNIYFGDGTPIVSIPAVTSTASTVPVPPHIYTSPGTYTVSVSIPGCAPQVFTVVVIDCPTDCCPNAVAVITSETIGKCLPDLTKKVKVEAVITPTPKAGCPTNVQAEMYIDGTSVASGSGTAPFTLTHTGNYTCGDHIVKIVYVGSDCPDSGDTFCVSVCETAKCILRRIYFALAATLTIVALLLYAFNSSMSFFGISAGITFVAAIILYIKWRTCALRCKKCPQKLANWQIAAASFLTFLILSKSSFIYIYTWLVGILSFAGTFAPALAIIILVIIVLLIILLIWLLLYKPWVAKCCPTECEKWLNIALAFGICLAAIGILMTLITTGGVLTSLFTIPYYGAILGFLGIYITTKVYIKCI
jgi:hypothetical protein